MVLRLRLLMHPSKVRKWHEEESSSVRWREYYNPPILFAVNFLQLVVQFVLFAKLVAPTVRNVFLMRSMFADLFCPDRDLDFPYSRIEDILDHIDDSADNLDALIENSFMNIILDDPDQPSKFTVYWTNGTITHPDELEVTTDIFNHIWSFMIETKFTSVSERSDMAGCTTWTVGTEFVMDKGSYTFTGAPIVNREQCPKSFMQTSNREVAKVTRKVRSGRTASRVFKERKKVTLRIRPVHQTPIGYELPKFFPQKVALERFGLRMLLLSVLGFTMVLRALIQRFKEHSLWQKTDFRYMSLSFYDQMHFSVGFWHPMHLLMDVILFCTSIKMLISSRSITQFMSVRDLRLYACAAFVHLAVSCRWFSFSAFVYEAILVTRIAFVRVVNLLIGISPLIMSLMLLGTFIFGLISDITRTYQRFLRLFLGLAFGDDVWFIFGYYTDGSSLFNVLSFLYVQLVIFIACYAFFPAFTATVTFVHQQDIIPIQEAEEAQAEKD